MTEISRRLDEVLASRRVNLPLIESRIARWQSVRHEVEDLEATLAVLAGSPGGHEDGYDVARLPVAELQQFALAALESLAAVRARVSRATINLGVSGAARNGKSTLLQALSGLTDQQIPTGAGLPVTAVRSQVFHSAARRASLTMHTPTSFLQALVWPFHEVLALGSGPESLDAFSSWTYPASAAQLPEASRDRPESVPMRQRLVDMQSALGTYREYLTGERREVPLAELRQWVAYPVVGDESPIPCRRYLAVREARIECPFPMGEAISLGLIDLPGLGEIAPGAEAHHVDGLRNDVDFVLVVKRPTPSSAFWGRSDTMTLDLLARARGPVTGRDFAAVVVNSGGCAPGDVASLVQDIGRSVNEGSPDLHNRVFAVDVKDASRVQEELLSPVLRQLAERLAAMDAAVLAQVAQACENHCRAMLALLRPVQDDLRGIVTRTPAELLIKRATALHRGTAAALAELLESLSADAEGQVEDEDYIKQVASAYAEVRDWVDGGFGEGSDAWQARALARMRELHASIPFAVDELNRIRVEMGRRFGSLDEFLTRRRSEFWARIVDAISPTFRGLLGEGSPQVRLRNFQQLLTDAVDPCPETAEAVAQLLDLRLDYRSRVFPDLRRAFEGLRAESSGDSPRMASEGLIVPITAAGASSLFQEIQHLAFEAAGDAQGVLLESAQTTSRIMLAYAEQFDDALIRGGESVNEFLRLADGYRDELWPEESYGTGAANVKVQRLRHAVARLVKALADDSVVENGDR